MVDNRQHNMKSVLNNQRKDARKERVPGFDILVRPSSHFSTRCDHDTKGRVERPACMISEAVNALFLTYLFTEYLIASNVDIRRSNWQQRLLQRQNIYALFVVVILNVLDRMTGAAAIVNELLQGFLHLPKILFAAGVYIVALYIDCRRVAHHLDFVRDFWPKVAIAFLYVLPVYPFLAVLISFVFLFVINLWEFLKLPEEWLNMPIYYGTLYGPFSVVYFKVKQRVVEEMNTLPTSTTQTPWDRNEIKSAFV